MSSLNVHLLKSLDQVLQMAQPWNDLWERCHSTPPTSRAEFLPLWVDQFAPGQKIQAVVVEEGDRLVAALPIVGQRWAKVVRAGSVPRNDWLLAGNLLVDEGADSEQALRLIAETLNKLPWSLYRFTHVPSHENSWRQFHEALLDAELRIEARPSFDVALVEINSDWETYQRSWSKNHRKNIARTLRRLKEQGRLEVRRSVPRDRQEIEAVLNRAFELEDSGWKGRANSSILRTPGMSTFMMQLSDLLARRQELEVAFLELDERPLAFELLWNAKGTLHSYKIGFDEDFRTLNPGQVLMHELLRDLFESGRCQVYDCVGPVSQASDKWCNASYRMSHWTVAPRKPLGRAVLFAYQNWRRTASRPLAIAAGTDDSSPDNEPSASNNALNAVPH